MESPYSIKPNLYIKKLAEKLEKDGILRFPEWAFYVKTGAHKEKAPVQENWWFLRGASILRKLYILHSIGVNRLSKKYGGKKNRGVKREKFYPGSRKIIRVILQQLDDAGLTQIGDKGRELTPKGRSYLDQVAKEVAEELKSQEEKKEKVEAS